MKIALVHDDLVQSGGAEKLFKTIAEIFPKAPIYTSLVNRQGLTLHGDIARRDLLARIKTSFIQKIPLASKLYKALLPLYPLAFESFNFDKYDVVISSTTRFAKAIITKPKTIHICYINSVPRFLWDDQIQKQYLSHIARIFLRPYFVWLRRWDLAASSRVDLYVSNSKNIQNQVKKIYKRESTVIYPYINTDYFIPSKSKKQDYFLVVTRLVKWKKIEIAIMTAIELNKKLVIVGDGPDRPRLERITNSNPNIFFTGKISDARLKLYLQFAECFIVTQEEDFGISAVEAQACGTPVIAYKKGGQGETIIGNKTGLFFEDQNTKSLKDALKRFSKVKWSKEACRKNSLRFTKERFKQGFKAQVLEYAKQ